MVTLCVNILVATWFASRYSGRPLCLYQLTSIFWLDVIKRCKVKFEIFCKYISSLNIHSEYFIIFLPRQYTLYFYENVLDSTGKIK
ncbi:hypothetical protein PAHAL_4G337600 [Panicum hallii]|uniref:Secreted protein n=1 Tax=Panicum hallii TaxID=206008 RepID=A0A2T8JEX9_9POAL|nr:hypothetical protein PAHAL_4G337600 [Panicum hallii]